MKRMIPSKHCQDCGRRVDGRYNIACKNCTYRYTSEYHKAGVFYEYRDELLTIEEWADLAKISKSSLYKYYRIYKDIGKCLSAMHVKAFVDSELDRKRSS